MSLLIKGMDIPEQLPDLTDTNAITIHNCQIFIDSKGNASIRIRGHREEYPIVKIPTSHGRLIDAEKLLIALTNDSHGLSAEQMITIMEFPTIIEAEVSE